MYYGEQLMKQYIVLRKNKETGGLQAYAETSFGMYWSGRQAITYTFQPYQGWHKYRNCKQKHINNIDKLNKYLAEAQFLKIREHFERIKSREDLDKYEVFLTRVGSKNCPVKVDLTKYKRGKRPSFLRKGNKAIMLRP